MSGRAGIGRLGYGRPTQTVVKNAGAVLGDDAAVFGYLAIAVAVVQGWREAVIRTQAGLSHAESNPAHFPDGISVGKS